MLLTVIDWVLTAGAGALIGGTVYFLCRECWREVVQQWRWYRLDRDQPVGPVGRERLP